ncbi:hypothetical protein UPYG_G00201010 [Umbra pygmaea]|uniref:Thymocyte nuclear protein 1 n=1 Tax=Umbra pygmaea TaxID=75934 RepID=A0ABD0WJ54_UMBPY
MEVSGRVRALLLLCWIFQGESQDVEIPNREVEVVKGQTVVLQAWYSPTSDISRNTVLWNFMANESKLVISYSNGELGAGSPEFRKRAGFSRSMPSANLSIYINNTQESDSGRYLCNVLIPGVPGLLGDLRLNVKVPPSPPVCTMTGSPVLNGNVTLSCKSSSGKPVPQYKWTKTAPMSEVFFSPMQNMAPKKRTRGTTRTLQNCNDEETENGSRIEDSLVKTAQAVKGKRKVSASEKTGKQSSSKEEETAERPQYSHWLMKSEPESRYENGIDVKFGIEDLKGLPNQTGCWDGVRNYQARNFMRDMKEGQQAFFYHSNCKVPGIAGIMKIVKESYVDHTQFDKKEVNYDASSKADKPKWSMVDVQFERMLKRFIPLLELKKIHLQHKTTDGPLKDMALFTQARLSVQPLTSDEFNFILSLED